jgi:DNA-binding CsgD family transcriptional regulator
VQHDRHCTGAHPCTQSCLIASTWIRKVTSCLKPNCRPAFTPKSARLKVPKASAPQTSRFSSGWLAMHLSYQQLLVAIRAVAGGATVFQPAVTERLLRAGSAMRIDTDAPREDLTGREAEVVRLMAGGYSNREIAQALGTAEGTVKNHVSSILAKFGVRDRTRAVLKALETGVLRAAGPGAAAP